MKRREADRYRLSRVQFFQKARRHHHRLFMRYIGRTDFIPNLAANFGHALNHIRLKWDFIRSSGKRSLQLREGPGWDASLILLGTQSYKVQIYASSDAPDHGSDKHCRGIL